MCCTLTRLTSVRANEGGNSCQRKCFKEDAKQVHRNQNTSKLASRIEETLTEQRPLKDF